MSPVLSAQGLCCDLGATRVLHDVDLELFAGELVGVIGPNGAGKSTLLQCLNGTLPSSGTLVVGDTKLVSLGTRSRAQTMALMHQSTSMSFGFPSRDVVMMGRYPHRHRFQAESNEDHRVVDEALSRTETTDLADQAITKMSGGETQRVLFAKALAQETPLLLLDEPTSNLDLAFQQQIMGYARDLAAGGRTVVAAIHDLRLALRFCSRLVLLSHGRVLADGAPQTVFTTELLSKAYGVAVKVYSNPVTGRLDYDFAGS